MYVLRDFRSVVAVRIFVGVERWCRFAQLFAAVCGGMTRTDPEQNGNLSDLTRV